MTSKKTNKPIPLFLITLPRTDKSIYEITNLIGLSITIENLKASAHVGQCDRCQRYGHSQSHCNAQQKCVKCGRDHWAADCLLIKGTNEPTCANCGGPHVASYRRCPKALKLKRPTASNIAPGRSYAQATKKDNTENKNPIDITDQIKIMLSQIAKLIQEVNKLKERTNK